MLNLKNKVIVLLVVAIALNCMCLPVFAQSHVASDSFSMRASGRFSLTVPAGKAIKAENSFPLEKGDTVRIKASYAPADSCVNIGLIGPDNQFYYVSLTNGNIDKTIEVNQHGYYTLAIENASDTDITVNGYVNY